MTRHKTHHLASLVVALVAAAALILPGAWAAARSPRNVQQTESDVSTYSLDFTDALLKQGIAAYKQQPDIVHEGLRLTCSLRHPVTQQFSRALKAMPAPRKLKNCKD